MINWLETVRYVNPRHATVDNIVLQFTVQRYTVYTACIMAYMSISEHTKLNTNVVQEAILCLKKCIVKATSQADVAKQSVQIIRTSIQLKG